MKLRALAMRTGHRFGSVMGYVSCERCRQLFHADAVESEADYDCPGESARPQQDDSVTKAVSK